MPAFYQPDKFPQCRGPLIAILLSVGTAHAGTVNQVVNAPLHSGSAFQTNVSNSSLSPSKLITPNKDEAFSHSVLSALTGSATLSVHACSSPLPGTELGPGGFAQGNGSVSYSESFKVTSAQLPLGSVIEISLIAGAVRRETATVDSLEISSQVFAQTFGDARIAFGVSGLFGSATYEFTGAFKDRRTVTDLQRTQTGLFIGPDAPQLFTVIDGALEKNVITARVGDLITILVNSELFSTSGAGFGDVSDANAAISLKWGLHPADSKFLLASSDGSGFIAPDNGDLTLPGLMASVPEVPETVPTIVPLPASGGLLLGGLLGLMGLARKTRIREGA